MYAISWPYGSLNHEIHNGKGQLCPDEKAFYIYGKRMSDLASSNKNIEE